MNSRKQEEGKMKNNFIVLFLFLLVLLLGSVSLILYINNIEYLEQVNERDALIKSSQIRDSISKVSLQRNADVITKYVNDCNLEINGKKITLDEFVKILNDAYSTNNTLEDSLLRQRVVNSNLNSQLRTLDLKFKIEEMKYLLLKDSLDYSYKIIDNFKSKYGIDYNIKIEDKYKIFQFKRSSVDSAMILLPYFRDRLRYDSTRKAWIITR